MAPGATNLKSRAAAVSIASNTTLIALKLVAGLITGCAPTASPTSTLRPRPPD
jgi:divalent metal cation (Fe/Co/Zn/Cd) transporter